MTPNRIHLVAPANPLEPEVRRFGFDSVDAYLDAVRQNIPRGYRLTFSRQTLRAAEREMHGGREDDRARIRDLNAALADPRVAAIVATNGGAYLARVLPHLDFSPLEARTAPLWALGFSELSAFVNLVSRYRGGRGVYWLCPNYLSWRVTPMGAAREAFDEFWRRLPDMLEHWSGGELGEPPAALPLGPIRGQIVSGRCSSGRIRVVGGCLSTIAAASGGAIGRRIRPRRGEWLALEDIKEAPYRIDRFLATLKIAGWFENVGGVLVGDFTAGQTDTQPAVLELLPYHLPAGRATPVVATRSFGHTWPIVPVLLNRPLRLERRGATVEIG